MTAFMAFTHKELTEALRTRKVLVLFAVFLLLGMMNPLAAKLVPVLLKEFMPQGVQITMGEPAAIDSWTQFFKNIPQTGLIVLVILYSGMMTNELNRGTLINLLTKGLPRRTVILSKLTMASAVFTGCYAVCFGVSWSYTIHLWPLQAVPHLILAVSCLWLYGMLLLASLILGGVLLGSNYGNLLFTGGFVVLMMVLGIVPALQPYLPMRLASDNLGLLMGTLKPGDFLSAALITLTVIAGFISAAIRIFNKKQL